MLWIAACDERVSDDSRLLLDGRRELISCSDDKRGAGVAPLDARAG